MAKKKAHAEHENAERWLLTYADLITLLLGLFVILYASAQVDQKKFVAMMTAFGKIFKGGSGLMAGGAGGAGIMPLPLPGKGGSGEDMNKAVQESIEEAINQGRVSLSETEGGLTVHVTEKLLFDPGQSALREEAMEVLTKLGRTLETMPNEIHVEGHTDDRPISTAQYPTNWHLGAARAANVLTFLLDHSSIDPKRMAVVSYGDNRPIAPNDSDGSRGKNRRVDIVIVK